MDGPYWLNLEPISGVFSGMPTAADMGAGFIVKVHVIYTDGTFDDLDYILDVLSENGPPYKNNPPSIITTSLPGATVNLAYAVVVKASDPDTLDTVAFQLVS